MDALESDPSIDDTSMATKKLILCLSQCKPQPKMRVSPLLSLAASATATNLFVSSYNGKITTLSLTESSGSYTLTQTHTSDACGGSPSWLQIDTSRNLLFCVNEGFSAVNGSISSLSINTDGSLSQISTLDTPAGAVNSAYYADSRGLAIADYEGAAVSTFTVSSTGELSHLENTFFDPASNGKAPHPHEVVVDPTGKYLLVPDLGSDLIRIFSFDASSFKLRSLDPLVAAPGSGPRHLTFWTPDNTPGGKTYMNLVSELAATVTNYAVSYNSDDSGLMFEELGIEPATGNATLPQKNAPAEIRISPNDRFLVISNRNDTAFTLENGEKSDSISTFRLDGGGKLGDVLQLWPAGGSFPRSFEINEKGDFVAVGLQNSQAVVVMGSDVDTGLLGETVARIEIDGEVTSVVWGE